jgi:hypothetical protein
MTHPLTDRLARAACPMAVLSACPVPCQDCRQFAERVAAELLTVVREIHPIGDSR